jgi:hypothetical protein
MPRAAAGLQVAKRGRAWYVRHAGTGIPVAAHADLRLRRHAVEFMGELYATGVDWTGDPAGLSRSRGWRRASRIMAKWVKRSRDCCDRKTGERYGPHSYLLDGRCIH